MKKYILTLLIFSSASIIYPHTVTQPILLNLGFQHTILSTPTTTQQHIAIPIKKEKLHTILIYNIQTRKQYFVKLQPKEIIIDKLHNINKQLLFITSKNQKKNINLYDLTTHQLTQFTYTYQDLQLHFCTSIQALFTAKNKNSSSFLIFDLKTKKITELNKKYQEVSQVTQIDQNQALTVVSSNPNQQQLAFIDLKKNSIQENPKKYNSISDIHICSSNKAIATLYLLSNKKEQKEPEKIGFIDLKKKGIIECPNKYYQIEYEILENKNIIAKAVKKNPSKPTFFFIEPNSNRITECSKNYDTILNFQKFSDEITFGFVYNNGHYYCLHINNITKDIKEIPISKQVFLSKHYKNRVINKEKILAYKKDSDSKKYSLGFVNPFTGIFEEKIKNLDIKFLNTKVNTFGQGIIYEKENETNGKMFILNIPSNSIQEVDKKYKNINLESFFHPEKLLGLATLKDEVRPVFINFQTNTIHEFDQSYEKIFTNLCSNTNKTLLASVLSYPNQKTLLRFDPNKELFIEYPIKEEFSQPFHLQNIYSFQPKAPEGWSGDYLYDVLYNKNDSHNQVALINHKNESLIRKSTYADHLYFIPYKKQLIICPDNIENTNLIIN